MSKEPGRQYEQPALLHGRGGTFEKDVPSWAKQEKITLREASHAGAQDAPSQYPSLGLVTSPSGPSHDCDAPEWI